MADTAVDPQSAALDGRCPRCSRQTHLDPGYSPWCKACGWNADPLAADGPVRRGWDGVVTGLAAKAAAMRKDAIIKAGRVEPRPTVAGVALLAASVVVLGTTFGLAALGAWLVLGVGGVLPIALGLGLIGLALLLRPRVGGVPEFLPRQGNEALFGVPDAVAASLDLRPVDGIIVSGAFNASVATIGWRRVRILELGIPLMAVLDRDERVAMLAHEFGHYRNGDPLRGFLGSTAVATIQAWYEVIRPQEHASAAETIGEVDFSVLLLVPARVLQALLSLIPWGIGTGLQLANLAASQRGEFYADLLAARAAGRKRTISMLDKLHLERVALSVVGVPSSDRWPNRDVWEALEANVAAVPAGQLERARRREQERPTSFGATHPPTQLRVQLVEALGPATGSLAISSSTSDAFEAALRSHTARVGKELVDEYRDSIYAG